MKNEKKIIEVINKFPSKLTRINRLLELDSIDFILDSTSYFQPSALLDITQPNLLVLSLEPSASNALEMVGNMMQEQEGIKLGMLTNDVRTFQLSIQKNFDTSFFIDAYEQDKLIPNNLHEAQLN